MPRKYHRPPATKRRKPRKGSPYSFEGAPEPDGTEDTELAASTDELDEEDWAGEARVAAAPAGTRQKGRPVQHLVKDHSYVRGEVARIVALGMFIIVSLVITALLRN